MNNIICTYELMLEKYRIFVPVENFCGDFKPREDAYEFSESNVSSAKHYLTMIFANDIVESSFEVEIDASQVKFTKIPRIVHVVEHCVYISR